MNIDVHTDHFHIRTIIPSDKDNFMMVRSETSDVAIAYEIFPDYLDFSWQKILSDETEISMVVFRENDGVFLATCSFQNFDGDTVDIGYDVAKDYRGQGIGTLLVGELISLAHSSFPDKKVLIRVRVNNKASQRVAQKLGGVCIATEDTPEAKIFMTAIEEFDVGKKDQKDDSMADDEIQGMKNIVEKGRDGVMIYQMP